MYRCQEHGYSLTAQCRVCSKTSVRIELPKFSLQDSHGHERRKEKYKLAV